MKNSHKALNEIDLDSQLEETQKLKQCILDFSTRLQKAQEKLLDEDASKNIKVNMMMATQKIQFSHGRRHNSQGPSMTTYHSRGSSKPELFAETLDKPVPVLQELPTNLMSNTMSNPLAPRHSRKSTEAVEDPQKRFDSLHLPITPSLAYRYFKYLLSPFEQSEILEYNEIFYLGLSAEKIKNYTVSMNYGYDDDRGDYKIVLGDHIAYRYEVLNILGKGSFGEVVKVIDHKTKEHMALKIIRNKTRFHQQAEVEVKILKSLLENDKGEKYNVVHIKDMIKFRNHTCIVFEMLGQSLYDVLKIGGFKGISLRYIKRYTYQVFHALYLLGKLKLIHCDLKPENVLLHKASKSSVKVIDFGSSCYNTQQVYTYIQSRFYRAPEIVLGMEYNEAIDVWSLGCIMVELYIGKPIFPGDNETDLFCCMMEVLGVPSMEYVNKSPRKAMYFNSRNEPRIIPNNKGKKRQPATKTLAEILNGADMEFIDLVGKCLQWEPHKRITPREALEHTWFNRNPRNSNPTTTNKCHRYHLSDTQFNHSSYNRIFKSPQTMKYPEKAFEL